MPNDKPQTCATCSYRVTYQVAEIPERELYICSKDGCDRRIDRDYHCKDWESDTDYRELVIMLQGLMVKRFPLEADYIRSGARHENHRDH